MQRTCNSHARGPSDELYCLSHPFFEDDQKWQEGHILVLLFCSFKVFVLVPSVKFAGQQ